MTSFVDWKICACTPAFPCIGGTAIPIGVGNDRRHVDDRGREFDVRIVGTVANSILQGNLVVSEQQLQDRFPSASGYRMFLIDAAPDAGEPAFSTHRSREMARHWAYSTRPTAKIWLDAGKMVC